MRPAIATVAPERQVTDERDVVVPGNRRPAGVAVRARDRDTFARGDSVYADVEEASPHESPNKNKSGHRPE